MDQTPSPEATDLPELTPAQIRDYAQMQRNGLAFTGGGHIPEWPMRDLTADEACARVPDAYALISVAATGLYAPATAADAKATTAALDPPPAPPRGTPQRGTVVSAPPAHKEID